MKTYKIFFIGVFLLLGISACREDPKLTINKVIPSTIENLSTNTFVLQNPQNGNSLLFTLKWSKTKFYLNGEKDATPVAPIQYTLQIDSAGNDFKNSRNLIVTDSVQTSIYTKDFNALLVDSMNLIPGKNVDIEFRIVANYGENLSGNIISTNSIKLSVTPFKYFNPLQQVYIFGDINGWNNKDTNGMFPMFKDNSEENNYIYTYTGYMPGGCYYKFIPTESLGSNKALCHKEDGKLEYVNSESGAFYNETDGYKSITIDLENMTYSVSDYNVSEKTVWNMIGLIGDFCGWDNEPLMTNFFSRNSHIWTLGITFSDLTSGNTHSVKFRANRSWGSRWAAVDPTSIPYGKTIFLTGSEYDPNIIIKENGDYHVIFNDLTGQYIIMKK